VINRGGGSTGRLYVVGSANMDLVVRAPRLPSAGETVLGDDLLRVPGGKGANQAVAAARLGTRVSFVGNVGDDSFGAELRAGMQAEGIDTHRLETIDRASGVALIVVDAHGENLIAVGSGANAAVSPAQVERALSALGADDVVLLQLELPLESIAQACQSAYQAGARVVLNAAPATDDPRLANLLRLTSVLIVNHGEAQALSRADEPAAAATSLRQRGPETVVVTLGGDGLVMATPTGLTRVPAQRVDVVDTTAAGDAFCGAFAGAILAGRPPEHAASTANLAAALATTRLGAQPSLPTLAELAAFST
jgi:ribokinase